MIPKDLANLRRLYLGFLESRVVLTANNLGVFESLKKASTVAEVSRHLKSDLRATEILLDALTGIGLLKKNRAGKYLNVPVSNRYLVKDSDLYQGDIIRHASSMWESFSALDEVVKTGNPVKRGHDHKSFIMGMHNLSRLRTKDLIEAIDLKGVKTMLDLGGGPGTNAMALAEKGVKAAIFDLPETIKIAKKVVRLEGVKGIKFIAGDFHLDDIGSGYDLILLSQILHAFSAEQNTSLLSKCRSALNPGGRVIVQEFSINESRTAPSNSALFSVNMLVGTTQGRCYTPKEMKKWLTDSGFKKNRVKNLPETILVEGTTKV